jgi:16S rRNA G1207 methylase RsmC
MDANANVPKINKNGRMTLKKIRYFKIPVYRIFVINNKKVGFKKTNKLVKKWGMTDAPI